MFAIDRWQRSFLMLGCLFLVACSGGSGSGATSQPQTHAISGAVTGAAATGVIITLSGPSTASATTDGTGRFGFTGLASGTYTLTPARSDCAFSPASIQVTLSAADIGSQDFIATGKFSVSGQLHGVSAAGVTVSLTGGATGPTQTGSDGRYVLAGLTNGTYTVTVAQTGYSFSPAAAAVTIAGGSVSGVDFTSTNAWGSIPPGPVTCASKYGTELLVFRGIWGSSADDVWAVGGTGGCGGEYKHWDGTAWSSGGPTGDIDASHAWGTAPNDVWAVGTYWCGPNCSGGATSAARWNGAWSDVSIPNTWDVVATWGISPQDVWMVPLSVNEFLHWNGSIWSTVPSGTSTMLRAMWGSRSDDVWAVGDQGTIVHWDGSTWTLVASGFAGSLVSVRGSSAADVWALGDDTSGAVFLHWNGATWSTVPGGTTRYLRSVWPSSPTDAWAVGEVGTIVHWDGSAWSEVPGGAGVSLYDVWGSSADDVWAVGVATILHSKGTAATHAIAGTITGTCAGGVSMRLGAQPLALAATDSSGAYRFPKAIDGTYTVTPVKAGCTFSPESRTVVVSRGDVDGVDFASTFTSPTVHAIFGTVICPKDASPTPCPQGVTVSLAGRATATTTTDALGSYSFTGLADGSYSVTPSKTNYEYSPSSLSVVVAGADVTLPAFQATRVYTVSGTVTGTAAGGVTVSLRCPGTPPVFYGFDQAITTDSTGMFSFTGPHDCTCALEAVRGGYSFAPAFTTVAVQGADVSGIVISSSACAPGTWCQELTVAQPLLGVSGMGTTDVWAVGDSGTALHWDGTSWSNSPTGTFTPLLGVWVSPVDVSVVGLGGTILWLDKRAPVAPWLPVASPTTNTLWAVSGGYAVGAGGTVLQQFAPGLPIWTQMPSPTTLDLYGVSTGAGGLWIVGQSPPSYFTLYNWSGGNWSAGLFNGGLSWASRLTAVWASSPTDGWAVGPYGHIQHLSGYYWSDVSSATGADLFGLWGSSASDVWAVGGPWCTTLHWDGVAWTSIDNPLTGAGNPSDPCMLRSVWGSSANDVWAVGYFEKRGRIFRLRR